MATVDLNAQAREIYQLLDKAETTNGDDNGADKLGASIWNAFVGEGQNEDTQIGTEKSRIKNNIDMGNAINSIISYLKNNDISKIQNALSNIGIKWSPKESYDDTEVQATKTSTDNKPVKQKAKSKAEQNVINKHNELKAKQDKLNKLATTEHASNGMTYSEAYYKLSEIRAEFAIELNSQFVYDPVKNETYFKRYTDEELPEFFDMIIKSYQGDLSGVDRSKIIAKFSQIKQECEQALAAKKELEAKHPELESWKGFSEIKIGKDEETKLDGTVERTKVRSDGSKIVTVEYLGGNSVSTFFNKDGSARGKTISEKDGNNHKITYVNAQGKVVGVKIINIHAYPMVTLQDADGNTLEPNSKKAKEIKLFTSLLTAYEKNSKNIDEEST